MDKKKKSTTGAVAMEAANIRPPRAPCARMTQNFLLVWLDESIDEVNNTDCRNTITQLRQVVNNVNTFTDVDECIDFVSDVKREKVYIIFSGAFGHTTVPVVHEMLQVSTIYIFCSNKARHEKWVKQWPKVNGVFTDIIPICEALKQAAQDCDQNAVSISIVTATDGSSKQNLDQLDQSFMYTQILKEILLTIDFEEVHFKEFTTYCRKQLVGNTMELSNVDKLEKEYRCHVPIWWYTYQCFLYSMLNRALRMMEVDIIIQMGFFVRDLHQNIAQLHAEQYVSVGHSDTFTVYRGQGLSQADFDHLMNTTGGLLSFNNFLSTSINLDVSLRFVRRTIATSDLMGIVFVMTIDPSIPSTPFAKIRDVSAYQAEEEILFSMHSIFRIGPMKQIDGNNRLWQMELTLTSDNDPQLHALTERMREETFRTTKGWYRLGNILIKLSQFNKAQQVYDVLLDQTSDEREKAFLYHHLGLVKDGQGEYTEAIIFYKKSIEINQKILSPNHTNLASSYNNIGVVYHQLGEYSQALSSHEKALEIRQKTLPPNHPDLATSYACLGSVYSNMGECSKALSSHEKVLEIRQKTLPPNHPDLATSYACLGSVYSNMGEYSKALSSHEKALEIRQKSLPPNHPLLATSYYNIGSVYDNMGEYSKALSSYEKAVEIRQKTLPPNHPDSATSYNNIGLVYDKMGEYLKALSSHEKALKIYQKTLPPNHPDSATSYNNIGSVYNKMGEYSKAVSYCERALDILQRSVPSNHPNLQTIRKNLEILKKKL